MANTIKKLEKERLQWARIYYELTRDVDFWDEWEHNFARRADALQTRAWNILREAGELPDEKD